MNDRVRVTGLLALELLLVAALHAVGHLDGFRVEWSDLEAWLDGAPFDEAVGAVIRSVALVLAYWLLMSTVAFLAVGTSGPPRLAGLVRRVTLPPIRRLVGKAVALSLAAAAVGGPVVPAAASFGGEDAGRVVVEVGPEGQLRPPGTEFPVDEARILVPPHLDPVTGPAEPDDPEPGLLLDGTVVHRVKVRRGDHMWGLAERHLESVTGRVDLGEREIADYWVRVIEVNTGRIRSGDPDLIYPGEILELPPVDG